MRSASILLSFVFCAMSAAASPDGERLSYVVGCINCHHQTPKEILNAPPLAIVHAYSIEEFETLLRTGVTNSGRDLLKISSLMGIVAKEQFAYLTNDEIRAIYVFLTREWNSQRAAKEEAKIPALYGAKTAAH